MKANRNTTPAELIADMTVDEKIAQIGSYWMWDLQTQGEYDSAKAADRLKNGIGQITRVAGASTYRPDEAAKYGNRIQKFLVEETRQGIPAILHEETCSGMMVLGASIFPQVIGLASTFQPELAQEMTEVIRKQMLAIGGRHALAPVLDLGRDPRWGRIEETFGEDPTLASQFGVAYIRGLQGDDLTKGVIATGKHFIGHSFSAGGLNCGPVHIGMNEIYDQYIAPFQAAIRDAGLATIMNSYPELDGEVVAASRRILTDILRGELGFDGLVVSDYEAIIMLNNYHFVAETEAKAAVLALNAGIDVEWPTVACYGDPLKAALEAGDINIELIDLAVQRHLQKKIELGLFDNPYVSEDHVIEVFDTPENRQLSRKIAQKSMVLLKNDGILPLKKDISTLAVIGPNADDVRTLMGDYSYQATMELVMFQSPADSAFSNLDPETLKSDGVDVVTVLDGIKQAVSSDANVIYEKGCDIFSENMEGIPDAVRVAAQSDVVVLVLGDRSGLTMDCTSGETRDSADLLLPGVQEELAKAVLATGKPVIVVLNTGRPYAISWLDERANAILLPWIPGEEGGNAVADVLFGDVNPAGRLPVTFPRHVGQVPINYNHKPSGMRSNWYIDYVSEKVTPLYWFGHGLSYTSFEYGALEIAKPKAKSGDVVDISVRVNNTGSVAGDEVVQVYIRDEFASTPRPMKELKAFARITLLPGEAKTVTFHLPVDQLAFINNDLELVIEAGKIMVMVGSSSEDIRQRGEFNIIEARTLALMDRVFECPYSVS
ncbi:MAG TPA: glycoside hydrolase family 3 N-terminal domain-containing protein [Anaerolineales bacterium]|nr:glycoside hydrolase family 3 N-terminal domain-containing protein [Anaerolineales bacterium]